MIRRTLAAALGLAALWFATAAGAQSYVVRDGNGSLLQFGDYTVGSVNFPVHVMSALSSGVPAALTITSGGLNVNLPNPVTIGNTVNVVCTSGCSSGGGSNAAAGPTGAAVPASASYTGLNGPGGLLKGWTGDASGYGDVNVMSMPAVTISGSVAVTGTFWQATQPVSGTFWQATQPISAAALPLPTGAATAAGLTTINTTLGTPFQAGGSIGNTTFGATQSGSWTNVGVTGTFWQATQPVSLASAPLPTGAATAANQTATLAAAGSSSTSVTGVQGVAGGLALPISAASLPLPAGASTAAGLTTINTTLGTPFQAGGSIGNASFAVTQATAASLNATVINAAGSAIIGKVGIDQTTPGTTNAVYAAGSSDPCTNSLKLFADFESTTSGGSIITAVSAKKAYICSISVIASAAANVSLIEGTGSSVCTGGTPAGVYLNTGVTAANGASVAANGGIQAGTGNGTIAANATANQNVCVAFTTTNTPQVNVHVSFVQQ